MALYANKEIHIRDFHEKDFDEAAALVADIWMPEPEEIKLNAGRVDLATYAKRATFLKVAECNNHILGLIAAKAGEAAHSHQKHWQNIADKALLSISECNEKHAQKLADYYHFLHSRYADMYREINLDTTYELVLFAVSSHAQGYGVGSKLLAGATNYLRSCGAQSYYLLTDTTCNWQFYENRQMMRCGEYKASEDEIRAHGVHELYIYSSTL